MVKSLFTEFYNSPEISDAELEILINAHHGMEIPKNTLLLEQGMTANENYLIESGLVRSFTYDYKGNDITTHFFCEGELAIDTLSFFRRMPSLQYMQTVSDCRLWRLDFGSVQQFFHTFPAFREWGRQWMTNQLFLSEQRTLEMMTLDAETRYRKLLEEKPEIILNAQLKHIATFLGIADATISRIRKKLAENLSRTS